MAETNISELIPRLAGNIAGKQALLGFDACVDKLYAPVQARTEKADTFRPFADIASFGRHIEAAAGLSCIVELEPKMTKLGGNGPIMASALAQSGVGTTYIGPVGQPEPHPVFEPLRERARLLSTGQPAETNALEFQDGKVMLADIATYRKITYEYLRGQVGAGELRAAFDEAGLVALLNWSCIPNLTETLRRIEADLLPQLSQRERLFFFDLADPARHPHHAIAEVVDTIARYAAHGRAILGMNLNEARRVAAALGLARAMAETGDIRALAEALHADRPQLAFMVHSTRQAAYAGTGGACIADGPYCAEPKISTGGGDHLNAGFCLALLGGASPQEAIQLGVLYSGYYVSHARTPGLESIRQFAQTLA